MIDRLFAIVLLIIMLPLIFFISIMIFIFSGRPIFFKHRRCGFNYREFQLLKFRTMYKNSGSDITQYNDLRITKVGKILRQFKLDEIPQLINIIKGEMVFIGPRPEAVKVVFNNKHYFNYLDCFKPGMTDISSIVFRSETNLNIMQDENKYYKIILPLKYDLANYTMSARSVFYKILVFVTSVISIIDHKLSLYIVNKYFLNQERNLRKRINVIISQKIKL